MYRWARLQWASPTCLRSRWSTTSIKGVNAGSPSRFRRVQSVTISLALSRVSNSEACSKVLKRILMKRRNRLFWKAVCWFLLLGTCGGDCAEDTSAEGIACSLEVDGEVGILIGSEGCKKVGEDVVPCWLLVLPVLWGSSSKMDLHCWFDLDENVVRFRGCEAWNKWRGAVNTMQSDTLRENRRSRMQDYTTTSIWYTLNLSIIPSNVRCRIKTPLACLIQATEFGLCLQVIQLKQENTMLMRIQLPVEGIRIDVECLPSETRELFPEAVVMFIFFLWWWKRQQQYQYFRL